MYIYIYIATVNKHDSSILQVARLGEEAPARPLIDKYVGHIYLPMYIYIYIYIYMYICMIIISIIVIIIIIISLY